MIEDQPPPLATNRTPAWELVIADAHRRLPRPFMEAAELSAVRALIADMHERDRVGRQRYGVPLTADNGRKHLVDAYQEGLDFAVYLRAELDERGYPSIRPTGALAEILTLYDDHLKALVRLRAVLTLTEA